MAPAKQEQCRDQPHWAGGAPFFRSGDPPSIMLRILQTLYLIVFSRTKVTAMSVSLAKKKLGLRESEEFAAVLNPL